MNGGSTSASPPGQWTADELMHGKAGDVSPPTSPNGSATPGGQKKRFSMKAMRSPAKKSTDPLDWGMPGHLTKEEVDVFVSETYVILETKMRHFIGDKCVGHVSLKIAPLTTN